MNRSEKTRCFWATNDWLIQYHDHEWGIPVHDDQLLFEFLILEGAQAGLSWLTVLKKREAYRSAFSRFDANTLACFSSHTVTQLLNNPGIIRNRLKIQSAITNAQAFLRIRDKFGSFDSYIWQFVQGQPRQNSWRTHQTIPCRTPESDTMSKDLKRRGFTFVGSTICYAFMQAAGMVNDHVTECFRYKEVMRKR